VKKNCFLERRKPVNVPKLYLSTVVEGYGLGGLEVPFSIACQ
jgi:hypothetical protein